MPGIDFQAVKKMVSIFDVIELIQWEPTRCQHKGLRGPCPVHHSTNPKSLSFAVSAAGFHCFKCGAKGNQIDLYAAVKGLPVYAAAKELCRLLGRPVPWLPRMVRQPRQRHPNREEER